MAIIGYDSTEGFTEEQLRSMGFAPTAYGWMDNSTAIGLGAPATMFGTGGILQMGYNIDALNRLASSRSTDIFNADMAAKHASENNIYSDIQDKLIAGPQVTPETLGLLDDGSLAKLAGDAGTGGASQLQSTESNPWYDFSIKDAVTGAKAGTLLGPVGAIAGGIIYGLFGEEIKGALGKDTTNKSYTDDGSLAKLAGDAGKGGASQIDSVNGVPFDFLGTSTLNTNTNSTIFNNSGLNLFDSIDVGNINNTGGYTPIINTTTGDTTNTTGTGTGNTPTPKPPPDTMGNVVKPDRRKRVDRRSMFYTGPDYEVGDIFIPSLIGS